MAVPLPTIGEDPWGDDNNAALTYLDDQTIAEIDRATQAEADLQVAIDAVPGAGAVTAEVTRATAAETALTTALSTETTARTTGDATNATAITAETTARAAADTTNATAIAANTTAITTEVSDRAAAVTAEAAARAAADTANAATEATARDAAITVAVATETTARTTADTTNATAIATETTARTTAVAAATAAAVAKAGDTMTGALTLPGNPAAALEAATKQYVDAFASGTVIHAAVVAATTGPGTLATSFENGDTLDGVTLATGNRILIKDQTAGAENGVYTVNASGAPTRALAEDSTAELGIGARFFVTSGTTNGGSSWVQSVATPTIGTTALVFVQSSGTTTVTAGTGITVAGNTVSVTNIDGAAGTPSLRTLGVGATQAAAGNDARWATNATAITTEATTRAAADTTNATAITAETTARTAADTAATTSIALKAPTASPTFTGTVTIPAGAQITSPVLNTGVSGTAVDVDATFAANSDTRLASQKAINTALGTKVGAASPTFTGTATTPALAVTGITGATRAARIVGGTASGKPTSGTFAVNDVVVDATGTAYVCTVAGTVGVPPNPVFKEIGEANAAFVYQTATSYTDGQLGLIPQLVSSDPSLITLNPPANGQQVMDVSALAVTKPLVGRNTINQTTIVTNPPSNPFQRTTTLQNVTGLVCPLLANTVYSVDLVVFYSAPGPNKGMKIGFIEPVGTLTGLWGMNALNNVSTVPEGSTKFYVNGWTTSFSVGGVGAGNLLLQISGTIGVGVNAGPLQFQAALNVANATDDFTIARNSRMVCTPLP